MPRSVEYRLATTDAIAFLAAIHQREPELAADIYEDCSDPGLLAWCLAQLYIGSLEAIAEEIDSSVGDLIAAIGAENAVAP